MARARGEHDRWVTWWLLLLIVFAAPLVDSLVPVLPGEVVVAAAATAPTHTSPPLAAVVAAAAAGSLVGECIVLAAARRLAGTRRGDRLAHGRKQHRSGGAGPMGRGRRYRGQVLARRAHDGRRLFRPATRAEQKVFRCRGGRLIDLGRIPRGGGRRRRCGILTALAPVIVARVCAVARPRQERQQQKARTGTKTLRQASGPVSLSLAALGESPTAVV